MIDKIKTYHKNKADFEAFLLSEAKFKDVKWTSTKTNNKDYPITAQENGVSASVIKYRASVIGLPKVIYNSFYKPQLNSTSNLSHSQFKSSLSLLEEFMANSEDTILSGINIGFTIPTEIKGKEIIKLNILMHKFNYYNHNVKPKKREEVKEFDYTNFSIGVYSEKKDSNKQYFLKIVLKLHNSKEFRKYGIENVRDLLRTEVLNWLFELFMKRFNELIIVDSFDSIEGDDNEKLKQFLNCRYWENLAITKSRQTTYMHRKKFYELINKYKLNTQKLHFEYELRKAFKEFISN